MRLTHRNRWMAWGLGLACGATCLQTSCTAVNFVAGLNPCGSVLECDPRTYSFIQSGYEGPGVDPNIDIFCTYPPYCTQAQDPLYGGLLDTGP